MVAETWDERATALHVNITINKDSITCFPLWICFHKGNGLWYPCFHVHVCLQPVGYSVKGLHSYTHDWTGYELRQFHNLEGIVCSIILCSATTEFQPSIVTKPTKCTKTKQLGLCINVTSSLVELVFFRSRRELYLRNTLRLHSVSKLRYDIPLHEEFCFLYNLY